MKYISGNPNSLYLLFPNNSFPEFFLRYQAFYLARKRAIISPNGEILFTIAVDSINKILQIPHCDSLYPFSIEALREIYQKLSFPQRETIFKIFLPKDSQLPKKNTPYPSSMFPQKARHIIFFLSSILGYYLDEWVDEPILGFLSTLSSYEGASITFDYGHFLSYIIHEQFLQLLTEGMFKYSSILMYMFLFFQEDKFPFSMQKLDQQGEPQ